VARNRSKEIARRSSDEYRINRRMYNMRPEVRQRKAIRRAIKKHQTPPSVSFGLTKPPIGSF
jgi:hypothetical protein